MDDQNNKYISNGDAIERLRTEEYWNELLLDYEDIIGIEGVKRRLKSEEDQKQRVTILLQKSICQQIDFVSKQLNITLESIFELAWGVLLQRYNNVDDVVFGELYQSKQKKNNCNMDHIYPVRVSIKEDSLISGILRGLMGQIEKSRDHPIPSIEDIEFVTALFDTMITCQEVASERRIELCEEYESIPYSMILAISRREEQIEVNIVYDSSRFQKEDMNYVMKVLLNIITDIVWNPKKRVLEIQALSKDMYDDMISKFNHKIEKIKYETIIELFQEHVASTPNKPVFFMEHERMTYQELDIASNQVAYQLKELGIQKNDFVALYTERSFQMIIAMLAVLKAGGAFVPIHLDTSKERFEYILNDCNIKLLITYMENQTQINPNVNIQVLDLSRQDVIPEIHSLNEKVVSSDVAFVIYTSGTTGKPKGIVGTHLSLLSAALSDIYIYGLKDSDVVLQYSNYTYIQAMLDIYSTLAVGGTICLISNETVHDFAALEKWCNENHVTKASLTPSIINGLNPENCKGLRIIDTTGEPSDVEVLKRWLGNHEIYNSYGTTEVVTNSSSFHYIGEDIINVPIGKPSLYSSYYILDQHQRLCGVGMIGELYIGGITLSEGYCNNPELTKQKFVTNPHSGERVYRTGDLARWKMDGNVECLKRIDDQIKISGRRIELEEVRGALRRVVNIKDCVVFAKKDSAGSKKIYAYYTSDEKLTKDTVRKNLLHYIPDYMVPAYIGQVDQIPVNKNGKVDKRALPDLEMLRVTNHKAPVTKEEILVEKIFCKVFHLKDIGVEDNFYDLGGDSISAIHIASQLLDYNYQVTAMDIMKDMTIRKIAERLNVSGQSDSKVKEIGSTDVATTVSDFDLSIINSMFQK